MFLLAGANARQLLFVLAILAVGAVVVPVGNTLFIILFFSYVSLVHKSMRLSVPLGQPTHFLGVLPAALAEIGYETETATGSQVVCRPVRPSWVAQFLGLDMRLFIDVEEGQARIGGPPRYAQQLQRLLEEHRL